MATCQKEETKRIMRQNIARLQKEKGLSSEEIDGIIGKKIGTTEKIKNGKISNPLMGTIEKIATALGVSLREIFLEPHVDSILRDMRLNIREMRLKRGLSPEEVDREIGAKHSYTRRVEDGTLNPCIDRLADIAHVLKVPMRAFFEPRRLMLFWVTSEGKSGSEIIELDKG